MSVMSIVREPVDNEEPQVSEGQFGGPAPSGAGSGGGGAGRPLRKDAERNRRRILKAAAEVFTERGLEATLDDVARHAGVGVATVYRRFPDKTALADALFEERIDALVALAGQAYRADDPWQGLAGFMEAAAEMLTTDKGLRQILMFASYGQKRVGYARNRMRPAVGKLVERAQAAGQVRPDLGTTDIPVLEFMLGATAEYARDVRPDIWRRYLTLMLDALRPARTTHTPLPVPELSVDELAIAMRTSPLGPHITGIRPAPLKPTDPENTE
jgi:AcrR family transcriptional regulator